MASKSDITRLLDIRIDPEELAGAVRGDAQAREHVYDTIAGPIFALITPLIRAS